MRILAAVAHLDRFLFRFLTVGVGLAFLGMFLAVCATITFRVVLELSHPWTDDLAGYLLVWSVLLGGAVVSRRRDHISVGVLHQFLSPSVQQLVESAIAVVGFTLCLYIGYFGLRFTTLAFEQGATSVSTYLPAWVGYLAIPLGLALNALGFLLNLVDVLGPDRARGPRPARSISA